MAFGGLFWLVRVASLCFVLFVFCGRRRVRIPARCGGRVGGPERLYRRLVGLGPAKRPEGVAGGAGLHRHWPGKRLLLSRFLPAEHDLELPTHHMHACIHACMHA